MYWQNDFIQQSFGAISSRSDRLTDAFCRNLFTDYPQVRSLFTDVDISHQQRKLWAMITLIATDINKLHLLTPVPRELDTRHVLYDVTDDLYEAFIATFCKSLREVASDELTEEVFIAWEVALDQICHLMIEGVDARYNGEPQSGSQSDDLAMLLEISDQPKVTSEGTRLFSTFLDKKRQDYEMEVAHSVQNALLPESMPTKGDYEFFASYISALEVGGDYYDYLVLDDDKSCLAFGDVSGKGVPGALIMSRLANAVQCTVPLSADAGQAVNVINKLMCKRTGHGRFVTFILIILNLKTNLLSIVNAGHRPSMIRKMDGSLEECGSEVVGLPLGILEDGDYKIFERTINPVETLAMFTDGIDEAMNRRGRKYGMPRLNDFLRTAPSKPLELGKALLSDVKLHAQ